MLKTVLAILVAFIPVALVATELPGGFGGARDVSRMLDAGVGQSSSPCGSKQKTLKNVCRTAGDKSLGQKCKEEKGSFSVTVGPVTLNFYYPAGCDNSVPKMVPKCPKKNDVAKDGRGFLTVIEQGDCGMVTEKECVPDPNAQSLIDHYRNLFNNNNPGFLGRLRRLRLSIQDFLARIAEDTLYQKCLASDNLNDQNELSCPSLEIEGTPKQLHAAMECSGNVR